MGVLAGVTLLAACEKVAELPASPRPEPRPEIHQQSDESLAIEAYYQRVQNSLLTQGLLRKDGGGPDVPFNARILTQNFLKIAFYQEYSESGGRLVAHETASALNRWNRPIRYQVSFGETVSQAKQNYDQQQISRFSNRLERLTGLDFTKVETGANLHIFIVNEDERHLLAAKFNQIDPRISTASVNAVINMDRETYCIALSTNPGQTHLYEQAFIVIRAEHPDLLRTTCIHEEMAQSLGLANDSPAARPSIFNDDEEFGYLTTHDEMLLRILYDPRLRPGMSEAEARPIVETIAAEQFGGGV